MGEVGRLHLLAEKFLVDETVEDGTPVVIAELGKLAVGEQSFVAESFVPVGLQNDMAVDGRDNPVDHLGGGLPRGKAENSKE
jgi:hypothetical protein